MLTLVARFTTALQFDFARMGHAAETGYLNAMAAATYLVHKGVPFRTALSRSAMPSRYAIDKGVELSELTLDELHAFGKEFDSDFFAAITVGATLDCHDVVGGTARRGSSRLLTGHRHGSSPLRGRLSMLVRKALLQDASNVYDLVNSLSGDGTLLKRASRRYVRTFATLRLPNRTRAYFSAAARCISTGHIFRGTLDRGEARGQGPGRGRPI